MLNVRLFDLTTLLFGVASVNYVAALYGKKDTLARIGTWICVAAPSATARPIMSMLTSATILSSGQVGCSLYHLLPQSPSSSAITA